MPWPQFGKIVPGVGRVYEVLHEGRPASYVFSAYEVWHPGSFTSPKALILAKRNLSRDEIADLQAACAPESITEDQVRAAIAAKAAAGNK